MLKFNLTSQPKAFTLAITARKMIRVDDQHRAGQKTLLKVIH
jgi:hypothetical protein